MSSKLRDVGMRFVRSRWCVPVVLLVLTALGAWLRLYRLGDIAMRMDEGNGWAIWKAGATIGDVVSGKANHGGMALYVVAAMWFVDVFKLPLDFFTFRLPTAIIGVLAIPLAYLCGRLFAGRMLGLIVAFLLAINPVHVQCSREMYPYVYAMTGAIAVTAAILRACSPAALNLRSGVVLAVLSASGFYLLMYSAVTAWPFAFLAGCVLLVAIFVNIRIHRSPVWPLLAVVIILALVAGGPAWNYLLTTIENRGVKKFAQASYHSNNPLFSMDGLRFVTNFAWGIKPFALVFTLLVWGLSGRSFLRNWKDPRYLAVLSLIVAGFLLTMVARYKTGNPFHTRFLIMLMPVYLLFLGRGLLLRFQNSGDTVRSSMFSSWARCALLAVCCALYLKPLSWVLASSGHPPFSEVVKWADANLSDGAPVLCDRYYTAWNEFRWNISTNVAFMSTVPNEPPDYYPKSQFRERSEKFFAENLDAALYEQRMFWNRFGAWTWPHEHFAHQQSFVDEATWRLHDAGLSYRSGGKLGISLEQMTTRLYYNTTEDFERIAKQRKTDVLAVFGNGWTYFKAQKFLDLRLMSGEASIDLYYFGANPSAVRLVLKGVASGGDVNLVINGRAATLPNGQFLELPVDGVRVVPGKNTVSLRIVDKGESGSFLVSKVGVSSAPSLVDP
jgi:uncharacterized membrane protein (UPF0136 family)